MLKATGSMGWISLVIIYTVMTFLLSSIRTPSLYGPFQVYRIDLLLHAMEYGILAWLMLRAVQSTETVRNWWKWFTIITIYCGAIGGLNELWQSRVPGRFPSLSDMLANIVGTVIVLFIFRIINKKQNKHRKGELWHRVV